MEQWLIGTKWKPAVKFLHLALTIAPLVCASLICCLVGFEATQLGTTNSEGTAYDGRYNDLYYTTDYQDLVVLVEDMKAYSIAFLFIGVPLWIDLTANGKCRETKEPLLKSRFRKVVFWEGMVAFALIFLIDPGLWIGAMRNVFGSVLM
jgi:hypothetical protein